jgi:GGDEF domain-containing protein
MLDSQKNLVFVTDGKKIFVANRAFIAFSGYESLEELTPKLKKFNERITFLDSPIADISTSWLEHLITLFGQQIEISIVDNDQYEQPFLVDVNNFPDLENRYLVSLTKILVETNESHEEEYEEQENTTRMQLVPRSTFYNIVSIADKHLTPLYLIYFHMSNIEHINLNFGYKRGDTLLEKFELRLSQEVNENVYVTRLAGCEYLMLCQGITLETLQSFVKNINRDMHFVIDDETATCKVRTSLYPFNTKANVKKNFQKLYEQIKNFRAKI